MLDDALFVELKASGNLPSPRGSALRVLALCQREDLTFPELIQALQIDPAMVGRLLKMANSASFGRPRPVAALTPDVLMSIGVQAVRQLVLAFSLVSGNREGQCAAFDYEAFWSRSAACGVAMQLLGAATRAAPPAELFTVGLLANVGRLALSAIHPAAYATLISQSGGQVGDALTDREAHAFGYTHVDVAAAMMRDWGLPRMFCDAVLHHETPFGSDPACEPRTARLVRCMRLASRLAALCFLPTAERPAEFQRLMPLSRELDIADGNLASLGDQMLCEWAEWSRMLEIAVREVPPFATLTVGSTQDEKTEAEPPGLSMMVIDDDADAAAGLASAVRAVGHAVIQVSGLRDGLVDAIDCQPQAVFIDLCSDCRGGQELIRTLRQTDSGRSIYVIVLTRPGDSGCREGALDAGADDYLEKPVDAGVLAARVRAAGRMIREQGTLRREREHLRRKVLELAISTQQAREAALTDVLTGLYNRRHALDRLSQEWSEAHRGNRPLAILMMDIDYFKAVNDSHGHDVGDIALRKVADTLRTESRMSDVVCRYGGEEFLLILPDTDFDGAMQLAERMRCAVVQQTLPTPKGLLKLSISTGIAVKGRDASNPEALVRAADQALYRAKQAGRNRVMVVA